MRLELLHSRPPGGSHPHGKHKKTLFLLCLHLSHDADCYDPYLQLLLNMVGVLLLAKVIEPIWGSRDFVKFVAIVNVCTGFSTFVLLYICYAVTMDGTIL